MAEQQKTAHEVTYDLPRSLGLTTVFGNPGSTEQTFWKNFPDDSTYVLGLQEASVMAMADGFASRPASRHWQCHGQSGGGLEATHPHRHGGPADPRNGVV
jgi:hypothetical protein